MTDCLSIQIKYTTDNCNFTQNNLQFKYNPRYVSGIQKTILQFQNMSKPLQEERGLKLVCDSMPNTRRELTWAVGAQCSPHSLQQDKEQEALFKSNENFNSCKQKPKSQFCLCLPDIMAGMAWTWIGVGFSQFCFFSTSNSFLLTPHCAHVLIGLGQPFPFTRMPSSSLEAHNNQ